MSQCPVHPSFILVFYFFSTSIFFLSFFLIFLLLSDYIRYPSSFFNFMKPSYRRRKVREIRAHHSGVAGGVGLMGSDAVCCVRVAPDFSKKRNAFIFRGQAVCLDCSIAED
jgi:hypothetical protein